MLDDIGYESRIVTKKTPKIEPCRLVLVTPPLDDVAAIVAQVEAALAGGDVASLIIAQQNLSDEQLIELAEALVPIAQGHDVATLIHGDSRALGRAHADGVHITDDRRHIEAAVERHKGALIVGSGGAKTRHEALERGEAQPDYMCFGLIGKDTHAEPHDKNLALAEWWVEMVDIPCIVAGGNDIATLPLAVATGAEFVMISRAIFDSEDPKDAVRQANEILAVASAERDALSAAEQDMG